MPTAGSPSTVPLIAETTTQADADAATEEALNAALGPVGEPASNAELLAASTAQGMSGLGRLAALRRRGAAPFNPRSYR